MSDKVESQVDLFKTQVAELTHCDLEKLDSLCFEHLLRATDDFSIFGGHAKKLLEIAREMMQ